MKRFLSSVLLLLLAISVATAQQRTVTGTVRDGADGSLLPGVGVRLKGTTTGTQTGVNGQFSIKVADNQSVLIFSYVGYKQIEIPVGTKTQLQIKLKTDAAELGEVVVVAYGSARRQEITGSVTKMSAGEIEKRTVTNVTQALAGVAPGVSVNAGNGQPGTGAAVRLRGFGSFNASNAPLYVVDGSVFDGDLGDINQNDIESISILKDATSSALYGSRGGNGVIIITTKKGKMGSPQFNANVSQGFSTRGTPEYDRLNAQEYYPAMWEAMKNSFQYSTNPLSPQDAAAKATAGIFNELKYNPFNVANNQIVGTDGKLNPNASLLYNDFDWYNIMQRTGKRTDAGINYAGKNEKSDYYISLGYLKDNGYIIRSDFERFNARMNANSQIKKWLRTGLNLSASTSQGNLATDNSTNNNSSYSNAFNFSRTMGPIYPVHAYDASGNPVIDQITGEQWFDYGMHPGAVNRPSGASPGRHVYYETMLNDNIVRRTLLGARSYVDISFLKDFTFTPSLSIDIKNNNGQTYQNPTVGDGVTLNGLATQNSSTVKTYTFNQLLKYNKTIGDHNISALVGHENYEMSYRYFSGSKNNIVLVGNNEFANFVTPRGVDGYNSKDRIESYLSKVSYNYDHRYFFEGSVRRDGSSRFSNTKRWGTFFSLGGSWALSKENFLKEYSWIDDLRLKVSYGEVGNNDLLASDGTSNYFGYQALYDLGWNNGSEAGVMVATPANPRLTWETSKTTNIGLNFAFFKNRLFGSIEYFTRGSDGLIFSVPQPLSHVVTSLLTNVGSMRNKGLEVQIGGDVISTKAFTWNLITNWTLIKNRITKMPAETPEVVSGSKKLSVGKDIYSFWLRQFAGVDPADGSSLYVPVDNAPATALRSVNGVNYVTNPTYASFGYSGSAIPDLTGSVNSSFRYKDITLSFLVNYQIGGKFYDSNYAGLMGVTYGSALHRDVLKSWKQPGDITDIPRVDVGATSFLNATSSRWLVDASYISFRNVNIAYNLPKNLLNSVGVSNARVFVTGENLGIISKRKGLNPTESFTGTNANTYLPSRTVSVGINLSL